MRRLRDLDSKIGEEPERIVSSIASDVAVSRAKRGSHSLQGSLPLDTQRHRKDMVAVRSRTGRPKRASTRKL